MLGLLATDAVHDYMPFATGRTASSPTVDDVTWSGAQSMHSKAMPHRAQTGVNQLTIFDVSCYPAVMDMTTLTRPLPVRHKSDPCCPVEEPSLGQAQTAALADRLKAVGDPTRLRMLDLLAQQPVPLCVCDLTPRFSQNQPTISHHLKLLREVGLIDGEKRGIWAYYRVTDEGRRMLTAVKALA